MFRVGYRTASFDKMDLAPALKALGRAGCDTVELCLERAELAPAGLTPERARELCDLAAHGGLGLHSISFHGDGRPWEERAAGQEAAVKTAPWFGVDVVVVNTPPATEGPEWDAVAGHFAELSKVAEDLGVAVAVEPEPGLVVGTVADMLRLLDEVDSLALAVNLDVGHAFLTEADVPAAIGTLAGKLAHVHFEDMPVGEHKHRLPGEGAMPLLDTTVALWDAGFRGPLTIDLFGPFDDPAEVAVRATAGTRRVIREAMALVHRRASSAL